MKTAMCSRIIARRQAINSLALLTVAAVTMPKVMAQSVIDGRFEPIFKLPPLPYAFDALVPHIDAATMEIHHEKHHAAYVGNINNAIAAISDLYFATKQRGATEKSLGEILKDLSDVPEKIRMAIRNDGGGHYNHSLFWQTMKKDGGGVPRGALANAISKTFGNLDAFKENFTIAALGQFGSGWAWLTLDGKELKIETTANQDNPLSQGRPALLGLDLWEHAYYLKYQNKRADYIAAWFNVVNWDFAADRYETFKA